MNKKNSIEILGWCGVLALLGAYAWGSFSLYYYENLWYHFLYMFGVISLAILCGTKKVYQPMVVMVIYGIIAIIPLVKLLLFEISFGLGGV